MGYWVTARDLIWCVRTVCFPLLYRDSSKKCEFETPLICIKIILKPVVESYIVKISEFSTALRLIQVNFRLLDFRCMFGGGISLKKNFSNYHLTNNNSVYEVPGKKPVTVRVRVRFRILGDIFLDFLEPSLPKPLDSH